LSEINGRIKTTKHYWAESSRDLLELIDELGDTLQTLKRAGFPTIFDSAYMDLIDRCQAWLSMSGGSTVPETFEPVEVMKWDKVFTRPDTEVKLENERTPAKRIAVVQ
jgi:hypothetical protein